MVENTNFNLRTIQDKVNLLLLLHKTMGGLSAWCDCYAITDPDEDTLIHRLALTELQSTQFHGHTLKNHLTTLIGLYNVDVIMTDCSTAFFNEYTRNMDIINNSGILP